MSIISHQLEFITKSREKDETKKVTAIIKYYFIVDGLQHE